MDPRTDGYYLSEQFHTEEMHAGVRLRDAFYRFLKFYPNGFWLWSDRNKSDFDFETFIREFDLAYWQANHKTVSPPSSRERDGGYLFQFGTYKTNHTLIALSFYSTIAEMELSFNVSMTDDGHDLLGWNRSFHFHAVEP